jgi:RNA polymerase sigma factor (sigma-70 family)
VVEGVVVEGDLVVTFEEAFEPMRRAAYRAAYRLLGERAAAEDVAAEAVARAYARWSSVSDHAEPWVIRVATNLALDVGRRRATASDRQVLLVAEAPADQVERRLDLQAALRALPRRQREVVVLRFLGDLSEKATADALALNVGTVKSHAARGLSRLRETVERV